MHNIVLPSLSEKFPSVGIFCNSASIRRRRDHAWILGTLGVIA